MSHSGTFESTNVREAHFPMNSGASGGLGIPVEHRVFHDFDVIVDREHHQSLDYRLATGTVRQAAAHASKKQQEFPF